MNKDRRQQISDIETRLTAFQETATALKADIESISDDETEAKEALPESMQDGDKGQAMDTAIENLMSAIEQIEDIESSIEEGLRYLEAARE